MSVDRYLTMAEAGKFLGVTRTVMWQLVRGGEIPYITSKRDRRAKLFKLRDLERFAQENPQPGKAEPPAA